jgi:hypothetical protein
MCSPPACSKGATIANSPPSLNSTKTMAVYPESRRALVDALASNPHVPTYLLGHKPIPQELPDYTWLAQNIVPAKPTLLN